MSYYQSDPGIDLPAFERLLQVQKEASVTGIVIAGSTGEGSTLSVQEKLSLVKKAKASVGSSLKILGSIGGSNTTQCEELAYLYQEAGADALLVVTPPYNKPSMTGLILHCKKIAEKVQIPLCLYHVPSRTGLKLSASQLLELEQNIPSIKAIKEASGDVALFSEACAVVYRSYKPLFTIFAKYRALNFAGKSRKSDPKFVKNQ